MQNSKILLYADRSIWFIGFLCLLIVTFGYYWGMPTETRAYFAVAWFILWSLSILVGLPVIRVAKFIERRRS